MPLLLGVLFGLLAGCASTRATNPALPTTPPSELGFYVGTWACDGTSYDANGGATERVELEIRVTPDISNWLHVGVYEHGKPVTAELKGYDPVHRTFHHLWASEDGASGTLTSHGWTGSTLVFEDDHPDAAGKTRMTFTKIDDTHYAHRSEVDAGAGYHLDFEKTCHKV